MAGVKRHFPGKRVILNSDGGRKHHLVPIKVIVGVLLAAVAITAAYSLQHTFSCFLLSFVFAYLIDPVLVMLEHRKIKRTYALGLVYVIFCILFLFIFAFFVPFLTTRWNSLIQNLPNYIQQGKTLAVSFKAQHRYATEWEWVFDNATDLADQFAAKVGSTVYAAAGKAVFNMINLVLAPILVFFMLLYKEEIKTGVVSWLPESHRDRLMVLGGEINNSVGGYIRGQIIVSIIVAILSSVALFFLGVDYPILNGIFAGLASILPFIGVILATIPPLFFAYVEFHSGVALLKVIGAFSLIYFVEGYVIKPVVFKQALDLNPLITIIFVMAFGEVMGFWGILLAIPIAAAIKIVLAHAQQGDFS